MKKKLLSLFLAICMLLSLIPVTAFAEGEPVNNTGKMTFLCQPDKNADNGEIYYKLDDAGEFTKVGIADHKYEPIDLVESTSITIKIEPNEGYKLDTTRGVNLWVNGTQNKATAEEIAALEFTYNLSTLVGESTVSTSSFELEFGFESNGQSQDPPAVDNNGKLTIDCREFSVEGGKVEYNFDGSDSFTEVGTTDNPENDSHSYNAIDLGKNTSITVKITPEVGYILDTMYGVSLWKNGNKVTKYTETALDALMGEKSDGSVYYTLTFTLTDTASSSFSLDFSFAPDNFTDGGNRPHGKDGYTGTIKKTNLTITGNINVCINDSVLINENNANSKEIPIQYHYNGGTVDFYIQCHINERYTAITINGTNYYPQLPTPETPEGRKALLDACKGQTSEFKLTVPYSKSGYVVSSMIKELDESDKDYMQVGNFLWRYDTSENIDDLIKNGKMELINVVYGGNTYTKEQLTNESSGFHWSEDENGGSAVLPAGAEVTVKIIPEYGYQLTSFELNGNPFTTGEEQSVFTFAIAQGNFHLGAKITEVRDEVKSEANNVITSGNITLGSGEINTGSAVLSVAAAGDTNKSGFEKKLAESTELSGYTLNSILDINLNQVLYKGCEDKFWETPMDTLKNAAEISLDLAGDFKNVVVLHKKHDGTFEKLATTFENGKITFSTNEFSDFALAVEELSTDNGCVSVGFDNRGDDNSKVMVQIGENSAYSANPWKWSDYSDGATSIKFTVTVPEDRKGNTPIVDVELKDSPATNKTIPVTKNGEIYTFSITPNELFADVSNPSIIVFVNWTEFDKLYPDKEQFMVRTNIVCDENGNENGSISIMGMSAVNTASLGSESKYIYNKTNGTLHVIFKPASGKVLHGFSVGETKYGFDDGNALPEPQSDGSYDFAFPVSGDETEIYIEAVFGDEIEQVVKPVISPDGGSFTGSQTVTITCNTEGAKILYGTDGKNFKEYTAPFTISASTTIYAYAAKEGLLDSMTATAEFTKKSSPGGTGGSGGSSGGSSTPDNPTVDGKEQTWSDVANDIGKLTEGSTETIDLNGNKTVPEDVIKAIASSNSEVTLKVDNVFSWTIDGSEIDEKDAKDADLSISKITVTADNTPRGTQGTSFSVKGTNVNSQLNINFKASHAREFANLYKKVDGKLVFVDNVRIDENGAAIGLGVSEKGEYVVMLGDFSDRPGDMDNDGIINPKDSLAVLRNFLDIEKGENPLVSDMNSDGYINPKDALIILKKYLEIE